MRRSDKITVSSAIEPRSFPEVIKDTKETISFYSDGTYRRNWGGWETKIFKCYELTELDWDHEDDKHVFKITNGEYTTFANGNSIEDKDYVSMNSEQLAAYQLLIGKIRDYGHNITNFDFFDNSNNITINVENGIKVELPSLFKALGLEL